MILKILRYNQWIRSILVVCFLLGQAHVALAQITTKDIAVVYGIENFANVAELRYVFHAAIGDERIVRLWAWEPDKNRVTFRTNTSGKTHTYRRDQLGDQTSDEIKQIDQWFINDQYWLLFPFHLIWDTEISVDYQGRTPSYIYNDQSEHFVITYPPTGGYTPGDVYELFVGPDKLIHEWVYRRSGSEEITRLTTWEDHRTFGGLTVSMMHRGSDDTFRLWFTSVAVRLKDSGKWIFAEREK